LAVRLAAAKSPTVSRMQQARWQPDLQTQAPTMTPAVALVLQTA
jgi:hypothetical protein